MASFSLDRFKLSPRASKFLFIFAVATLIGACSSSNSTTSPSSSTAPGSSSSSGAASSGEAFEGAVSAKLFGGEKAAQMNYLIKGNLSRIETTVGEGGQPFSGVMIMDTKAGTQTVLMPQTKSYMTMSWKKMIDDMGKKGDSGEDNRLDKLPKITATGKTETIAGYTCEHFIVGDDQTTDLCVSKGLGYFGFGNEGQSGGPLQAIKNLFRDPEITAKVDANPEWKKFIEGGAFPLKISQIENGQTKPVMEVTSVERKKLDDSIFAIPADYKKMEIPGMMMEKK